MNKKTITCITYSPICVYADAKTPWDDVWLRLWNKRKRVFLGPAVAGLANLRQEVELEVELEPEGERLKFLRSCQEALTTGHIAVESHSDGVDTVYVNKEMLTRKDIEGALEEYLRQRGYLKGPVRFRWKRPNPKIFIFSM